MMRPNTPALIAKKRDGQVLSDEEIRFLIEGYTAGRVPDYQMAAWAMAVYLQGMTTPEATALTLAMAQSGSTLAFPSLQGPIVDKHSTGGVGDKVSLVLAPLVAAAGMKVAKLSGRGLGHTGGTIDKLEAIPGFHASLTLEEMVTQVNRIGLAISASTLDLAPADKKLYALRDVTATVGSLPLIASSVMSKKLAVSSQAIMLDVKVGRGALMKTLDQARALAQLMVEIGNAAGRRTAALLSDMDQPLGFAVGNALEVREAIETLSGKGPADLRALCLALAVQLHALCHPDVPEQEAQARLARHLDDGSARAAFRAWIEAQGGNAGHVDHPRRLPTARETLEVRAPRAGHVAALDALAIGQAAHLLGAGRTLKDDAIDPAVGVVLRAKVGDAVAQGQPLAELHLNDTTQRAAAQQKVADAFEIAAQPPPAPVLIHEHLR